MCKIKKILSMIATGAILASSVSVTGFAETAGSAVPSDFESADLFYNTYGETAINATGDGAIIVVRDDGITDKYKYVFDNSEESEYSVESSASYGYYDVYEVSFKEKRDYKISLFFWNSEKEQIDLRGAELNLFYEYDNNKMKVSDVPSTNKQLSVFREKYGDYKQFGDKLVAVVDNAYIATSDSADASEITAEYKLYDNLSAENMQKYGDDITIPVGGKATGVYELNMNKNGEYALQVILGVDMRIESAKSYLFKKNEKDEISVSDSIQLMGDVDNNGTVGDLYDIIEIAKYLMGSIELSQASYCLADVNSDHDVNIYDAIAMAKTLMK